MPPSSAWAISSTSGRWIDLEPAQLHELVAKTREQDYLLVDVREPEEYQAGHLPGAVNLPLLQLEAELSELPARKSGLIFYSFLRRGLGAPM